MWDHSFCIRDWTNVSCFGSGILYHRATMQDPLFQIFFPFFFFHWGGKDLQYCVAFRCRATQFSDTYVPVYSFTNFLTLEVIIESWVQFPVHTVGAGWISTWDTHIGVYRSIQTFYPFDLFPLVAISLISVTVSQFQKLFHYCWCLNSTYEWHNILIVCVCLTELLSRISYRCIYVAKQTVFPPFFHLVILHCTTTFSTPHWMDIFVASHMLGDPNNAALNMGLDVSFQCPVFNRDTAKCGIAWS